MATENAPAPAPAHSAPAPAPRFSSFHRTLQEETLAKLVKIGPDYWNRIQEYHDHFDRLQQARAHLEAQAEVVRACAAAMDALHDKARANQSVITCVLYAPALVASLARSPSTRFAGIVVPSRSNQFGPVTIQDMDDVSMLLTSMRHFEWDVVAPYRARVYPDPDWYTAVPCFPARMEKALPITAQDVLDHSPLLEHIFCDPYPDFSQGAVDAARAYLEAIAEPAVEGAAASPSLSAVREPLHADIRPFAQLWSTVLQVFAPGPEESVWRACFLVWKTYELKRETSAVLSTNTPSNTTRRLTGSRRYCTRLLVRMAQQVPRAWTFRWVVSSAGFVVPDNTDR